MQAFIITATGLKSEIDMDVFDTPAGTVWFAGQQFGDNVPFTLHAPTLCIKKNMVSVWTEKEKAKHKAFVASLY